MEIIDMPLSARAALAKLNTAGYEAYLVGGCVRDSLLGQPVKDWDITTSAQPEEMRKVFAADRVFATGEKHGTLTVRIAGLALEITTYRTEGRYPDHRHPAAVRFVRSLDQDLSRRDFTINALAYHPMTGLIDRFGGQADLAAGRLSCIGEPRERFGEDALRILRALRFASRLGFRIAPATDQAIRELKGTLAAISVERVRREFLGLLVGKAAGRVLADYREVIEVILPVSAYPAADYAWIGGRMDRLPADPLVRLAYFLSPADRQAIWRVLRDWKLDNASRERIKNLTEMDRGDRPETEYQLRCWLRDNPEADVRAALAIRGLREDTGPALRLLDQLTAEKACCRIADLAVDGSDLVILGYEGPQIGRELEKLLESVLRGKLENDRAALLRVIEQERPGHDR